MWGLSSAQEAALMATVTKHCPFTVLSPSEQQVGLRVCAWGGKGGLLP